LEMTTAQDLALTATQFVEVDLKDATYRRLTRFANRIDKLLTARPSDPHLRDTLDLFLGVIYALALAKICGFVDRTKGSTQTTAITARARDVATGKLRLDGQWMAGFHFNSALFRIAAVYHRLLKIVVDNPGTGETVDVLRPKADKLYAGWTRHQWSRANADSVHGEVTRLKHKPSATLNQRRAKFEQALDGVEELLKLIEAHVRS
jgi:hypothetical protein